MYSYVFDEETGGIILSAESTSSPREPRPVYAPELDMYGFDKYWKYDKQSDVPYMWSSLGHYWYRGKMVGKVKGGSLCEPPEVIIPVDDEGNPVQPEPDGGPLKPIDMEGMVEKNRVLLGKLEDFTIGKTMNVYEKYKDKVDIFYAAYSGGKDSTVLLDLVKRALPKGSFVVVFGDTGMEFPDTYVAVEKERLECEKDGIPFYVSKSHFDPHESWKLFGPPSKMLRWCCCVHKSAPNTLKLREITGKSNCVGMDFVGVRASESATRSKYQYEEYGKKHKGQYNFNAILEWTSAEVWLYIFLRGLYINEAYKKGCIRAGCILCPMGTQKGTYVQHYAYPKEVSEYIELVKSMNARDKGNEEALSAYVSSGDWSFRRCGRSLVDNEIKYKDEVKDGRLIITVKHPSADWKEWIKTVGPLSFDFSLEETEDGYIVSCDSSLVNKHPTERRRFKQVFRKAAYCVGCGECEANCVRGAISFENGLKINGCVHCGQCHDMTSGCLRCYSREVGKQKSANA